MTDYVDFATILRRQGYTLVERGPRCAGCAYYHDAIRLCRIAGQEGSVSPSGCCRLWHRGSTS